MADSMAAAIDDDKTESRFSIVLLLDVEIAPRQPAWAKGKGARRISGSKRNTVCRPIDAQKPKKDLARDGQGGFVVAELEPAPRRIVHCNRAGEVLNEWFGGQPYYAWGEPDPRNPSHVWFNSGHWLVLAEIDYTSGDWRVLETWHLDQMADGLVESRPAHHGRWWVVYHEDQRYLVSQGATQVLAHEPGSLRPVSVIGSRNVKRAVELAGQGIHASSFRWLDRNGDG
jgi:hypothetical protein